MSNKEKMSVVKQSGSDPLDMKFEIIPADDLLTTQRLDDLIAMVDKKTGEVDSFGALVGSKKWATFHEDVKNWIKDNYKPNAEI